jgi:FkbM family methyltransferase
MKRKFNVSFYQSSKKDFYKPYLKNNFTFALFPKDNAITSSIIEGWQYHNYMFEFFQFNKIDATGCDIVDIGANNGQFSLDFAHMVGDNGRVHSFEPQRILYYQLCGHVFMNGLDNVFCYNVALGDKEEVVEIEKPDYFYSGHVNFGDIAIKNEQTFIKTEKVRMRTLDSYKFNNLLFIKLDVQGYEPFVLEGAVNTINEHRPFMMVEFEEPTLNKHGKNEEGLRKQIEELGYEVKLMHEGITYQSWNGKPIDHICIPKEKMHLITKIP